MRKIAAVMVLLIFFAGISTKESDKLPVINEKNLTTIDIQPMNKKIAELDSLLIELNKQYDDKKKY